MVLYSIEYTDAKGDYYFYMNVGYETKTLAVEELKRLLKFKKKYDKLGLKNKFTERSNYKIVKRKLIKNQ